MIIGVPKRTLVAFARVTGRTANEAAKPMASESKPKVGPITAFTQMMERQAELIIRQMGE